MESNSLDEQQNDGRRSGRKVPNVSRSEATGLQQKLLQQQRNNESKNPRKSGASNRGRLGGNEEDDLDQTDTSEDCTDTEGLLEDQDRRHRRPYCPAGEILSRDDCCSERKFARQLDHDRFIKDRKRVPGILWNPITLLVYASGQLLGAYYVNEYFRAYMTKATAFGLLFLFPLFMYDYMRRKGPKSKFKARRRILIFSFVMGLLSGYIVSHRPMHMTRPPLFLFSFISGLIVSLLWRVTGVFSVGIAWIPLTIVINYVEPGWHLWAWSMTMSKFVDYNYYKTGPLGRTVFLSLVIWADAVASFALGIPDRRVGCMKANMPLIDVTIINKIENLIQTAVCELFSEETLG